MKKLLIVLGLLLTLSACDFNNNSSDGEQTPTDEKSNTDVTLPDIPLN